MDFEKLDVWKRSASLSAELYTQLRTLNDYGFKDQITRSGLSVPSNIAEGMTRQTSKGKSWLTETREIASMISGLTKKLRDSD